VRRLLLFALGCLGAAYLLVNTALAWSYVNRLTHPGCPFAAHPVPGPAAPLEISLPAADRRMLRAWHYPGSQPLAILALGGQAGALGQNLPPVEFLIEAGYPVLQLDSRACASPPGLVTLGAQEAQDASAGVDYLLSKPGVKRVAVIGFSMGGVSAIRLAAQEERVAGVIAEGGYDNLGRDMVETGSEAGPWPRILLYSIAYSYWIQTGFNPWEISPIHDLPRLSPRPVLLIYGEHEVASGRGDQQYAAAQDPKTLWVVLGGDHGANYQAAQSEYRQRVLEFLQEISVEP
jgi:uncharacterized protein